MENKNKPRVQKNSAVKRIFTWEIILNHFRGYRNETLGQNGLMKLYVRLKAPWL